MARFMPQQERLRRLFPVPGELPAIMALEAYLYGRDGICWVGDLRCSKVFTPLHHAVLRKSDVQGWQPKARRVLIDTPYNLIRLCTAHHETALEPKREEVADWMFGKYGSDFVRWLRWLQFKVHPLRGWLERH